MRSAQAPPRRLPARCGRRAGAAWAAARPRAQPRAARRGGRRGRARSARALMRRQPSSWRSAGSVVLRAVARSAEGARTRPAGPRLSRAHWRPARNPAHFFPARPSDRAPIGFFPAIAPRQQHTAAFGRRAHSRALGTRGARALFGGRGGCFFFGCAQRRRARRSHCPRRGPTHKHSSSAHAQKCSGVYHQMVRRGTRRRAHTCCTHTHTHTHTHTSLSPSLRLCHAHMRITDIHTPTHDGQATT